MLHASPLGAASRGQLLLDARGECRRLLEVFGLPDLQALPPLGEPFVRDLLATFDGQVKPDSITPLARDTGNK